MNAMLVWAVCLAGMTTHGTSEQPQPAKPAATPPAIQDKPNPDLKLVGEIPIVQAGKKPFTGEIRTADDLLRTLETADADLKTLESSVLYSKIWMDGSDRHVRVGKIAFRDDRAQANGARKFAVLFDKLDIGGRVTNEPKEYVFDGQMLVERLPEQKKMNVLLRLQPGQSADPLRIGEGPVPIPIGQDRTDILARYDATLLDAMADLEGEDAKETEDLKKFLAGSMQLKLTPKQANDKYKEVRLWYRRGTKQNGDPQLLPRLARATLRNGDVDLVQLFNVKTNEKVEDRVFRATSPDGWQVQEVSR